MLSGGRGNATEVWTLSANPKTAAALDARLPQAIADRIGPDTVRVHMLNGVSPGTTREEGRVREVNIFTLAGDRSPDIIVVGRELKLMLDNDFSFAWLAHLSSALNDGGALLFELPAAKAAPTGGPRLGAKAISERTDLFKSDEIAPGWLRLHLRQNVHDEIQRDGFGPAIRKYLNTAYPSMMLLRAEFESRYTESSDDYIDGERLLPEFAANQFVYTLHGMSQKSKLVDHVLKSIGHHGRARILDMGGGYGAMAVELATAGHEVKVIELEPAKIENVGTWLAQQAGVTSELSFVAGDFDAIDAIDERFDVISFFASLLYYPRENCADLLERCKQRLADHGVLIIHENPKERAAPDARDYKVQFYAEELDGLARNLFEHVEYLSIFSFETVTLEDAQTSVMVQVARDA